MLSPEPEDPLPQPVPARVTRSCGLKLLHFPRLIAIIRAPGAVDGGVSRGGGGRVSSAKSPLDAGVAGACGVAGAAAFLVPVRYRVRHAAALRAPQTRERERGRVESKKQREDTDIAYLRGEHWGR